MDEHSATETVAAHELGHVLPDDRLHETLLNLFRHRVDPLARVLHWPSFLRDCESLRRRLAQAQGPLSMQQPVNYYAGPEFVPSQQGPYSNLATQDHQPLYASSSRSITDGSFIALLYTVYYAAAIPVQDSPHPPDLGQNVSIFDLAAAFRNEVTPRVLSLNEHAKVESIPRIQAVVLALVRCFIDGTKFLLIASRWLSRKALTFTSSGSTSAQQFVWHKDLVSTEMGLSLE